MNTLALAATAITGATIAAHLTGRITLRTSSGYLAIANTLNLTNNLLRYDPVWAAVSAAGLAWSLWLWWHGGGGDDTKRRLRRWSRRFEGVRRTAPAGSPA